MQLGFCYLPPGRNTQCNSKAGFSSSRIVLGGGMLPVAVRKSPTPMRSAPLVNNLGLGFRSRVTNIAMASLEGPAYETAANEVPLFFDTGAFAQAWVPQFVFNAYMAYFTTALKKVSIMVCVFFGW